jgi:hypothetical protein
VAAGHGVALALHYKRPALFLLGHSSIQTTERYLGSEQDIEIAVNDNLGLSEEDKTVACSLTTPSGEEHQFTGIVDVARWATATAFG